MFNVYLKNDAALTIILLQKKYQRIFSNFFIYKLKKIVENRKLFEFFKIQSIKFHPLKDALLGIESCHLMTNCLLSLLSVMNSVQKLLFYLTRNLHKFLR